MGTCSAKEPIPIFGFGLFIKLPLKTEISKIEKGNTVTNTGTCKFFFAPVMSEGGPQVTAQRCRVTQPLAALCLRVGSELVREGGALTVTQQLPANARHCA